MPQTTPIPAARFLTEGPKGAFVVFDYVVSIAAVLVNLAVLQSVIKARMHLTGYKYGLVSLGVGNLYLCCVNISIFVIDAMSLHNIDSKCWGRVFRSLQMSAFITNLLNLSAMSLDHLIGILYPLMYSRVTRKFTIRIVLAIMWTTALLVGSAEMPLTTYLYFNQPNPEAMNRVAGNNSTNNCSEEKVSSHSSSRKGSAGDDDFLSLSLQNMKIDENLLLALKQDLEDADRLLKDDATSTTAKQKQKVPELRLFTKRRAKFSELVEMPSEPFPDISPTNKSTDSSSAESGCFMSSFLEVLGTASGKSRRLKSAHKTWCHIYRNEPYLEYAVITLTLICFTFVVFCYGQIFKEIFFQSSTTPNKHNLRKLVMTTFILLGTFSICYLPFMIFELSMVLAMHFGIDMKDFMSNWYSSFMVAQNVFNSMLLTSPLLQPLLYAGRLSVVRRQLVIEAKRCCSWCVADDMADSPRSRTPSLALTTLSTAYESGAKSLCGRPSVVAANVPHYTVNP